jgi:hypothetical protein
MERNLLFLFFINIGKILRKIFLCPIALRVPTQGTLHRRWKLAIQTMLRIAKSQI